ncbi:hypothetical protein NUW58_g4036 [Xylaria curta]|uniref:Uncharacterized protein n=1 Tax=Xylaria curta TaxID=42375 RepID=A0ACC1P867_9PEZI|nr:hypothetical protein NUW58_g4036 [Xylaria curta]
MSKAPPRSSKLTRLDGVMRVIDRTDPTIHTVVDFNSSHGNRHATQEKQLVPYKFYSRSQRAPVPTTSTKGESSTKPIARSSRVHFTDEYGNELVSNLRVQTREEVKQTMSSAADNRAKRDKMMAQQQFDAIWDPAQNRDLTIHLKMDVSEDLTDTLEELCYLQRLGDFSSARRYFGEYLGDHVDDPYVLVQYGEMLLEQGDYLGISKLSSLNQYQLGEQKTGFNKMQLLKDYWDLILFFAECHYKPHRPRSFTLNLEALRILQESVTEDERDVTSTEIKYLALLYHLCGVQHPEIVKKDLTIIIHMARMATGSPWLISAAWSTNADLCVRLHDLVAEWTNSHTEYDAPSLLALLDILTSLVCWDEYSSLTPAILTAATHIARLIIDHHPEAMKTRPVTQWMLLQCENAEMGSRDQLQRQEDHLDTSPGILYRHHRRNLVQYAPYKTETPSWICQDGPSELQNSARIALRTSVNLADYRTQAKALQLLILMSAKPATEFEELGKLQKLSQGDNYNLAETLAAKYLVSNDDVSRRKLRGELMDQWSMPWFSGGLSAPQLWILSMIRHALAQNETEAEHALSQADVWYRDSPSEFVEHVNKKLLAQQTNEARTGRPWLTKMGNNRRIGTFSISPEPRQRSTAGGYESRGTRDFIEGTRSYQKESRWEGGGRLDSWAETRDIWRAPTRNVREAPMQGFDPISISDARHSRTSPTDRVARELAAEYVGSMRGRNIPDTKRRPLDETDLFRGRSRYRDGNIDAVSHGQRTADVERSKPGNQSPMAIKADSQNTRNDLGRPDNMGHQSTHDYTQEVQPTLHRVPDNEYEDSIHHEGTVTQKRQEGNTSSDVGSQTDFDAIKPPSRGKSVTMEMVRDVGENMEAVGSPIPSGSDGN